MNDTIVIPVVIVGLTVWLLTAAYEFAFVVWRFFQRNPMARIKCMAAVYLAMLAGPSIWVAIVIGRTQ